MASSRPGFIDLPKSSTTFDPQRLGSPSPRGDIPSPRSGDVPPALSPLDAFALQGRLLAAKFDEQQDGRRISRLPPLTVANEFARPRQTYFSRPFQNGDYPSASTPPKPEAPGNSPEVSKPKNKYMSFYPSIQGDDGTSGSPPEPVLQERTTLEPVTEERSPDLRSGQESERTASPEPLPHDFSSTETSRVDFAPDPPKKAPTNESLKSNWSSSHGLAPPPRSPFAPPRSPRGQPSIRSVRMDSGDDSDALSFQSDPYDLTTYQRKSSLRSMKDRPRSPFSPTFSGRRSPSISSEISNTELQQPPRRSLNFSRPLSPAMRMPHRPSVDSRPSFDQSTRVLCVGSPDMRPSMDVMSIQDSIHDLEQPSQPWADDNASSNLTDDEQGSNPSNAPAASYTYAKYTLPRGRKVVSNGSFKAQSWLAHQFEWDHPTLESAPEHAQQGGFEGQAHETDRELTLERQPTLPDIIGEPSPDPEPARTALHKPQAFFNDSVGAIATELPAPERPVASRSKSYDDGMNRPVGQSRFHEEGIAEPLPQRPKSQKSNPTLPKTTQNSPQTPSLPVLGPQTPSSRRKSEEKARKSEEKSRKSLEKARRSVDQKRHKDSYKDTHIPTPDQVPAEDHLAKGIELHETGNFQKATYHLRIAARAGLPSAMLLYALACRHGWGMRPNQQEAVLWLRQAVDVSRLEVDQDVPDDLLPPTFGGPQDKLKQKQHKAQLALSIYELGVSYLNGWGIQQDKNLALKCFEIAAGWGDADATSEAGFCYAKGVGCKKNLTKAAGYYRQAEQLGVSMAGNSWIYKDKYNPKEPTPPKEDDERGRGRGHGDEGKDKKKREKSRTRSFWGGKFSGKKGEHPELPS